MEHVYNNPRITSNRNIFSINERDLGLMISVKSRKQKQNKTRIALSMKTKCTEYETMKTRIALSKTKLEKKRV